MNPDSYLDSAFCACSERSVHTNRALLSAAFCACSERSLHTNRALLSAATQTHSHTHKQSSLRTHIHKSHHLCRGAIAIWVQIAIWAERSAHALSPAAHGRSSPVCTATQAHSHTHKQSSLRTHIHKSHHLCRGAVADHCAIAMHRSQHQRSQPHTGLRPLSHTHMQHGAQHSQRIQWHSDLRQGGASMASESGAVVCRAPPVGSEAARRLRRRGDRNAVWRSWRRGENGQREAHLSGSTISSTH